MIEAAGFSTIIHTPVPDTAVSVSAPRISAIEFPLGRTFGHIGESEEQRSILLAALQALETIQNPGAVVHQPFLWAEKENAPKPPAVEPPPIAKYLMRHPMQVRNLINRKIPQ